MGAFIACLPSAGVVACWFNHGWTTLSAASAPTPRSACSRSIVRCAPTVLQTGPRLGVGCRSTMRRPAWRWPGHPQLHVCSKLGQDLDWYRRSTRWRLAPAGAPQLQSVLQAGQAMGFTSVRELQTISKFLQIFELACGTAVTTAVSRRCNADSMPPKTGGPTAPRRGSQSGAQFSTVQTPPVVPAPPRDCIVANVCTSVVPGQGELEIVLGVTALPGFKSRILRHADQQQRWIPAIMRARRYPSVRRQGLSLGLSSPTLRQVQASPAGRRRPPRPRRSGRPISARPPAPRWQPRTRSARACTASQRRHPTNP